MIIVVYSLLLFFLLIFLGYGLASKLLPSPLQAYKLLIGPWLAIVTIIVSGTLGGFIGFTGEQWVAPVFLFSLAASLLEVRNINVKKRQLSMPISILLIFSLVLILANLSPLIVQQKFMTTISMGSNDAQAFAIVPDFLVSHSVKEGFGAGVPQAVYTLLPFGYRIGQSIIAVFFMVLFNLRGFEILTVIQTVLFGLAIPLVYIVQKQFFKENAELPALTSAILVGLNVNLLYYLYHNFFGQVLFMGLYLVLVMLFIPRQRGTRQIILAGSTLAALYYSYHEAVLFIVLPLLIMVGYEFFLRRKGMEYLFYYIKIGLVTMLLAGGAVMHSITFALFYRSQDFNSPIGWQAFRAEGSSFINPVEMLGVYSIHNLPGMPTTIVVILSALIISVIFYGFKKAENKSLLSGLLVTYIFFFVFLSYIRPNFWFYDRAVSYALPILIVIFIGGLHALLWKKRILFHLVLAGTILLAGSQTLLLHKRYLRENLAVDKWIQSVGEIKEIIPGPQKIYSEQLFSPSLPIWKEIWAEYFLEPGLNYVTSSEYNKAKLIVKDDDLILVTKNARYASPANLLLSKVLWENQSYKLGSACISDRCITESQRDLSFIDFERPTFSDSLLGSGWSVPESGHRWIASSEASFRLVSKKNLTKITIEAMTLNSPQEMSVFIADEKIGTVKLFPEWKTYQFAKSLNPGILNLKLVFPHTYRPSALFGSFDTRDLSANIKTIRLE